MSELRNDPVPENLVILDTNVLIDSLQQEGADAIDELLTALSRQGFQFCICIVSLYEGCKYAEYEKVSKFLGLCDGIGRFYVVEETARMTGCLHNAYTKHQNISENSISTEDKMIAATAALNQKTILTSDRNDFPAPFFNELRHFPLPYKSKDRMRFHNLYWLEPNKQAIDDAYDKWYLTPEKKAVAQAQKALEEAKQKKIAEINKAQAQNKKNAAASSKK